MAKIKKEKKNYRPFISIIFISALIISLLLFIDSKYNIKENIPTDIFSPDNSSDSTLNVNESNHITEETLTEENVSEESKTFKDLTYSGWIPTWNFQDALTNIRTKKYPFESVSPVWYAINEDGTLTDRRTSTSSSLTGIDKDIIIIPTITQFDSDIFHSLLNNETYFNTHISTILDIVEKNDYDGIDLDYEKIYLEDKQLYMKLLKKLSDELHKSNKILSVTVLSQWGASSYKSFPETRQVQDPVEISKYADEIRVMCYDYTTTYSEDPGPVSPIIWVESTLKYMTSLVDKEKLVLGINLYGYRWGSDGSAFSSTYNDYSTMKTYENFTENYNYSYEEGYAQYKVGSITYEHYYQTPESLVKRVELAAKYNIKGVVFWRLGLEDGILDQLLKEL